MRWLLKWRNWPDSEMRWRACQNGSFEEMKTETMSYRSIKRQDDSLRVLLVGNYQPEAQESMQRFAQLLSSKLPGEGITVKWLRPEGWLICLAGPGANLHRGGTKFLGYVDKFLIFPFVLWLESRRHDLIHICDHSNAMYGRWTAGRPWVLTVHDLLAVRSALGEFPQNRTRWSGRLLQQWISTWLGRAPRVVCVSEATRKDVLRLTRQPSGHVSVIHVGLNHAYQRRPQAEWRPLVTAALGRISMPAHQRFVLHIGGDQWYKNRPGVVDLFASLASGVPDLHLILAGKLPSEELRRQISESGLGDRIHFVGPVSNAELEALYHAAEFLLFPSLAEGFGWPVIEAQACGCRVAASDVPPLPEVGGASCVYLNLTDREEASRQLLALLDESESERCARIQAGLDNSKRFNPEVMARRYSKLYREALHVGGTAIKASALCKL